LSWAQKWKEIKFNMQGPMQGLFLMFGYGNELGWFYKSPSLVWRNVIWWLGSMCHIKYHTTNKKCDNPNYIVLHKMASLIKQCKNPKGSSNQHMNGGRTSKIPPILGTLISHQNNNTNFTRFWTILDRNEIQLFNFTFFFFFTTCWSSKVMCKRSFDPS
jgi:hypothetical protein